MVHRFHRNRLVLMFRVISRRTNRFADHGIPLTSRQLDHFIRLRVLNLHASLDDLRMSFAGFFIDTHGETCAEVDDIC